MAHVEAEIDVIAADPGCWRMPPDRSLDDYADAAFGSVRRVGLPGGSLLFAAHRRQRRGPLPYLTERPDPLRFARGRASAVARSLGLGNYDLIVTRSQFHSAHLVGLALARDPGAPPWVAHFSDPWVGNPREAPARRLAKANESTERAVVAAADALVFTSERAAAFTLDRYGGLSGGLSEKTHWVPHCFDPSLYPEQMPGVEPAAPLLVRHVGHLRHQRRPGPLLAAAAGLLGRGGAPDFRIEFVGDVASDLLEAEGAWSLPPGIVTTRRPVDYCRSLAMMAEADLLVAVETDTDLGIDLHGKVVDYVGAGRPMLAMTPPGTTGALVESIGGIRAPEGDGPSAFGRALAQAAEHRAARAAGAGPWGDPGVRRSYDAAEVGARLTDIYTEATVGAAAAR